MKQTQRKFVLACFFAMVSAAGLFCPPYPIDALNFIWLVGLILGIYSGANVFEAAKKGGENVQKLD